MTQKFSNKAKPVYVVSGEADSQETIIRQRKLYEDFVRTDLKKKFSKTNLTWNMAKSGNFFFKLEFMR